MRSPRPSPPDLALAPDLARSGCWTGSAVSHEESGCNRHARPRRLLLLQRRLLLPLRLIESVRETVLLVMELELVMEMLLLVLVLVLVMLWRQREVH